MNYKNQIKFRRTKIPPKSSWNRLCEPCTKMSSLFYPHRKNTLMRTKLRHGLVIFISQQGYFRYRKPNPKVFLSFPNGPSSYSACSLHFTVLPAFPFPSPRLSTSALSPRSSELRSRRRHKWQEESALKIPSWGLRHCHFPVLTVDEWPAMCTRSRLLKWLLDRPTW